MQIGFEKTNLVSQLTRKARPRRARHAFLFYLPRASPASCRKRRLETSQQICDERKISQKLPRHQWKPRHEDDNQKKVEREYSNAFFFVERKKLCFKLAKALHFAWKRSSLGHDSKF